MLTGTQVLFGEQASTYNGLIGIFTQVMLKHNYLELVVPSVWKGALISNVCPIIQELHHGWGKKPIRLFYVARTFQSNRERTIFGASLLGTVTDILEDDCLDTLMDCINKYTDKYSLKIPSDTVYRIEMSNIEVAVVRKYRDRIGWKICIESLLAMEDV